MSPGTVETGRHLVHITGQTAGFAGRSAREALMVVAPQFLHSRARSSIIREQYANQAGAEVTLYGLADALEILVLGYNHLAEQIRVVLRADQISDWRLHELPTEQTPVQALYARLSVRTTNILQRVPFVSAQEVAALPDEVLLDFRGLGPKVLAEIRSALADPSLGEFTIDLSGLGIDPSQVPDSSTEDLLGRLRPEHRARYRNFLYGLATLGLPAAVFEKILDSIGAEPVPVADRLVVDTLIYARADDLLDYYVDTHEKMAPDTSGTFLPALPATAARLSPRTG
ncbi:hypothetical protein I6A60_20195 [Frankia sp. AgB1.9]|uniref:DNA-directed RNA polymerase subunit alpha C-terminal domain-containing protein n=1 Tax=unclassified Frankia TaxID=2632575 RepID=UPI00193435BE|nr:MULTISPECIES: DNA-directed RNA polymerase subunit alpha C-terminal domain-containing protein [unclassified Frankia]MBL7491896.1 hypothetical protein [Frankia sp. AgW1.1]MBL7550185.1 hypothetical protein [Frankia sp. AgB1.9]MBL7619844.1 hypothetical protein [Frankia sp. AgB1.8]